MIVNSLHKVGDGGGGFFFFFTFFSRSDLICATTGAQQKVNLKLVKEKKGSKQAQKRHESLGLFCLVALFG